MFDRTRWITVLVVTGAAAGAAYAAGKGPETPQTTPWRGWDRYQAIMWSTGSPQGSPEWIVRLKELGCTGEEIGRGADPAPFTRNDFGFYVENLVGELGFLNNRRSLYDEDFKGYTATHDRRFLVRKPCFDDPAFW